jgi:hypothetical protein
MPTGSKLSLPSGSGGKRMGDFMWDLVWFALGLVAFVLVLQLLGLPEWIDAYLKRRRPGRKLEQELAELRKRVTDLESRTKS